MFKKLIGVLVVGICVLCINVNAEEMSDEFKSILNKDGYLEVNSVPPKTEDQAGLLLGDYVLSVRTEGRFGINPTTCNSDYTVCDIDRYEDGRTIETHAVKILYKYNENIKKLAEEYGKRLKNKSYFAVRDMEVVNFWINAKGQEDLVKNYSTELKETFDFNNFEFDIRMGNPDEFVRSTGGEGNIVFDGTIYYFGGFTEVEAKHILYVPEDTGNTKEELMAAIQKRIDNYIGKDVVNITYGGYVYDYYVNGYNNDIVNAQEELNIERAKPVDEQDVFKIMDLEWQLENLETYKNGFIKDWTNKDGYYGFLTEAQGGHYFYATIPSNSGSENVFKFIIIKDDEKMFEPTHKTTDVVTNVTISSNNSSVPLDTMINVKELTSGEDYEKIVDVLNLADNLMLDLKLYSNGLDKYITKLNNGDFEVKIPIPENFNGKDLVVYYVDEVGKTEEYEVTIKNGYAIFNTTHFSIYTLGYKEEVKDDNKVVEDNKNETNKEDKGEEVPKTFDGISASLVIGSLSLIGLATVSLYLKKEMGK